MALAVVSARVELLRLRRCVHLQLCRDVQTHDVEKNQLPSWLLM